MPSLFILLPLISFTVLNLPFKDTIMHRAAFGVALFVSLFQAAVVIARPPAFWDASRDPLIGFFGITYTIDTVSLVALLSIGIVLSVCLLTGRRAFAHERQRFHFTNLLLLALTGMNVIVLTTDIFSMYVFIELTAIASFILIAITKDKAAVEGALKYIFLSAVASVLMLSSVGLLLLFSGGTSFQNIATALQTSGNAFLLKLALGLFLCGVCIKAGIIPFHGWLPDAYSAASAPVSVFLAGIATKVSGVYVLLRLLVSVFRGTPGMQEAFMFIGTLSIVAGALLCLTQTNFKRLLAYSSISQVGYIILAAGCATPLAIMGAAFHFFNHAVFKSLLFVNAAAVERQAGTLDLDKMDGLAQRMPVTATTSVIASLSAAGIPPLAGFWSKLIIVLALWNAGSITYAVIALLASILTLAYFLYLQRQVFFGKILAGLENIHEVRFDLIIPQVALAAIIILVGLGFPLVLLWK